MECYIVQIGGRRAQAVQYRPGVTDCGLGIRSVGGTVSAFQVSWTELDRNLRQTKHLEKRAMFQV